jgi:hypothetical protein
MQLVAACMLLATFASTTAVRFIPPIYRLPMATSSYDLGLKHGQVARAQIQGWLRASNEMASLWNFITTNSSGRAAFAQLQADNTAAFPDMTSILYGIADGAQVNLSQVHAFFLEFCFWSFDVLDLKRLVRIPTFFRISDLDAQSHSRT